MKRFFSVLLMIVCCCGFSLAQSKQAANGSVKGVIYAPDRDAVDFAEEFTITGEGIKKRFRNFQDDIEYNFNLPAGYYSVTASLPNYYYAFKRAIFRVEAGKTAVVNLYPALRVVSLSLTLDEGCVGVYNPEPKYDTLQIAGFDSDIVVEYSEQKDFKSFVVYKNAKLTFDNKTLLADSLWFNKKSKEIKLDGNILIDDGGRRIKTNQARVKLKGRKLIIKSLATVQ